MIPKIHLKQEADEITLFSKVLLISQLKVPLAGATIPRGNAESKIRAGIPQTTSTSGVSPGSNPQGHLAGFYLSQNI